MSRSGYYDDHENQWGLICWRGAVASGIKGARGQAFLREMVAAMDAMPVKELVSHSLQDEGGCCALGSVGVARGMDMADLDPENMEAVHAAFGISDAMAREIVYQNDEAAWTRETPDQRWQRMRGWAVARIASMPEPSQ